VLAEPLEDCLWQDADGRPCLEVRSPVDLEADVGLPGGNIFQRDLQWPWAEGPDEVGRWGVETAHPRVLLCGAGARRGGGVSGIPGTTRRWRCSGGRAERRPGRPAGGRF
jgi:phytoene dehydrogenase-like protein